MSIKSPPERTEAIPPAPSSPASAPVERNDSNGDPPRNVSRVANRFPYDKPIDWPLFWATVQYWLFTVVAKVVGAVLYLGLISMGLRLSYPEMGVKLSKVLPWLDNYELTYKWDRAHLGAIGILFFSWTFCHLILRFLVSSELADSLKRIGWSNDWPRRLTFTIGVIIMTVDACVFYRAFNAVIWGQSSFSASAIITTLGYVTLLVATTFYSLYLGQILNHTKKGKA